MRAAGENGTVGTLDLSSHEYQTRIRSHTGNINAVVMDPHRNEFATVTSL